MHQSVCPIIKKDIGGEAEAAYSLYALVQVQTEAALCRKKLG